MKITVKLSVNTKGTTQTFDPSDFGLTASEWNELSEEEQYELIQDAIDELPEQPYWEIDSIE